MTHTAQFNTVAPMLVRLTLAQAEQTALEEHRRETGDYGGSYPGYRWELMVEPAQNASGDGVVERLARIEVSVALEGSTQSLRVVTYRITKE